MTFRQNNLVFRLICQGQGVHSSLKTVLNYKMNALRVAGSPFRGSGGVGCWDLNSRFCISCSEFRVQFLNLSPLFPTTYLPILLSAKSYEPTANSKVPFREFRGPFSYLSVLLIVTTVSASDATLLPMLIHAVAGNGSR